MINMTTERIVGMLKYSILVFILIVIFIMIKGFNYRELGFDQVAFGQGWFTLYQYKKSQSSFVMSFGKILILITLTSGVILDFSINIIKSKMKKRIISDLETSIVSK